MRYALFILIFFSQAYAESPVIGKVREITIMGRDNITITQRDITLGDIADITSTRSENDEAVIGLKKITIEQSPEPGKKKTITAHQVLSRLKEEGVNFVTIGYSFPKEIQIVRASRMLSLDEITNAVARFIENSSKDLILKKVDTRGPFYIAPGLVDIQPINSSIRRPGEIDVNLRILVDGREEKKIGVVAQVDEFKEIPVASRPISKGDVIGENDVVKARLNISQIPKDAMYEDIVGQASSHDVPEGKTFKKGTLSEPLVIQKNSKVTLIYKSGALEASATGVALEGGALNQEIRIKNDVSQKIVAGTVLESGLVKVTIDRTSIGGVK